MSFVRLWSKLPVEGARDHSSVCKLERNGWIETEAKNFMAEYSVLFLWEKKGGTAMGSNRLCVVSCFLGETVVKVPTLADFSVNLFSPLPRASTIQIPCLLPFTGAGFGCHMMSVGLQCHSVSTAARATLL